jgi:hypothetical protein
MSENGKTKNRSPEHPIFDLSEAIDRARVFYEAEHFNWAPKATAMKHWGYGPKSSSGLRALAALLHYGLLDEEGSGSARRFRLSQLAKTILLRETGSQERRKAIRVAALKPAIYMKLWEEWGNGGRLPSDESMRYQLETTWEFNPRAIDSFIADFRSTMELAGLLGRDTLEDEPEDDPDDSSDEHGHDSRRREGRMPDIERKRTDARPFDLPIPLEGGTATLRIPVPMSKKDYDLLTEALTMSLKLYKGTITEQGEPEDDD